MNTPSHRAEDSPSDFFPWFYQTGLEYTLIMTLGGIYRQYEVKIDRWCRHYGIMQLMYIVILVWAYCSGYKLHMIGLGGLLNTPGALAMMCGVTIITTLCKRLNSLEWLAWIGKNSIVFYFFPGVYPAMVNEVIARLCPDKFYLMVLPMTVLSVCLGAVTTFIVMKCLPFMVDLRKLYSR